MSRVAVQRVDEEFRRRLRAAFRWQTDDGTRWKSADLTGWWRDAELLRELGPALTGLYDVEPTVVVGFVEVQKNGGPATDSDRWVLRTTGPDYRDRHVEFGFPHGLISAGDRVLMVDDWVETGATARVVRQLVDDCGAHWIGAAVIVDGLLEPRLRHDLPLRALLDVRTL